MYAVSQKSNNQKPQNSAFLHGIQQVEWRGFLFGGFMRTCNIEGCNNKHIAKGYCQIHYVRYKKHGDPSHVEINMNPPEYCTIKGCNEKHYVKGYCRKHYRSWYKYGDPIVYKNERHGMKETPEYRTWNKIKNRCLNPNVPEYKWYGARGIKICDRWRDSFIAFYKDMGLKPFPKAEIDRINNDGNYESGNCRWTTHTINMRNSRVVKLNMEIAEQIRKEYIPWIVSHRMLAKKYNVNPYTIYSVLNNKTWI